MTSLAVASRTDTSSRPRLDIDLEAVGRNTRLLADRAAGELMAVVKADGFGHGAVDVARTALANGATRLGVTTLDEAWPLRDAGLAVPLLSWLNPVDADYATAAARDVDVAVPSLQHLAAVAAAPGRARVHLHVDAGMARDGADPASWALLCRAARRAEQRGELEVVGVMGHLGCADEPDDECNALGADPVRLGARDRPGLRPAPARPAPRRHRRDPHRPAHPPHDEPRRRRPGRHRPVPLDPAARRDDPDRAGRPGPAGPRRHPGRLRPHPPHRRPPPTSGWCRSGTPTVCRGSPPGAPRCWCAAYGVRSSGGSPWTSWSSTSAIRGVDLGETVTVFGPGAAGEPTVAEWAAWADTIEHEIVTGIGARVRAPHPVDAAPAEPVVRTRVAVIGGGQNCEHDVSLASAAAVAGALDPAAYDVVPLTIDRDGTWRDRRAAADRAVRRRRACCAAATWCSPSCTARAARTARSPPSASWPACAYVGSGIRPGALAMDKWATKLVAGGGRHRHRARTPGHAGRPRRTSAGPARSW